MTSASEIRDLELHAISIRRSILRMLSQAGSGHSAGSLDSVEIFTVLYGKLLHLNRADPSWPGRDYFLLSAGHICPALYAALAEFGYIPAGELLTLRQFGSRLQGHPERTKLPWLETTSGPLGEGLSQAGGIAYALKYLKNASHQRVYCLMGDGECDEGEIWEAAMFASKYHLSNLIGIIDVNHIQLSGPTDTVMNLAPFAEKWQSFGWNVHQLEQGNDMASVVRALESAAASSTNQPQLILAQTTAGYGVSFMRGDYHWHGKAPTAEQAARGIAELDAAATRLQQEAKMGERKEQEGQHD